MTAAGDEFDSDFEEEEEELTDDKELHPFITSSSEGGCLPWMYFVTHKND